MKNRSDPRWKARQAKDPFVKQAKAQGLRSRASFKLLALEQKYGLFAPGMRVLELGAAPGGWTQVLRPILGAQGDMLAVDCLAMAKVPQVTFLCGDIKDVAVQSSIDQWVGVTGVNWVISDMAPNLTGIRASDQAKSLELNELCLHLSLRWLKPGKGGLLIKVFQGSGLNEFFDKLKTSFKQVEYCKPEASRAQSRECYILARGLR